MKSETELGMGSSFLRKSVFSLTKAITSPRSSMSWLLRGHMAKDKIFVSQTYWFTGNLPRVPLAKLLPGVQQAKVVLPRAFDRKDGTSVNLEEACHLAAIAQCSKARKALEIGTYDGGTTLLLAANLQGESSVVTVDLPPDFDLQKQGSLTYTEVELNLTQRSQLGRQYRDHELAGHIRQVYGDSAALDWNTFGGPFDLVFIDGCHSEQYVRVDSENAIKQLAPGGIILWHDYGMVPEVSKVVDEIASKNSAIKVYALEGTRLAVGLT